MSLNTARSERAVKSIRSPLICMRSSPMDASWAEGGWLGRERDWGFVLFLPSSFPLLRVATSMPNCRRSRNALGNCRNCLGTRGRTDSSRSTPRWNGAGEERERERRGILHIEWTQQTRFNCDPLYNYVMIASVSVARLHNENAYIPSRILRYIALRNSH